jgi:hypothetical protein
LFTAATAAKEIVAWAKYSPAASCFLLFLDGNKNLVKVLVARLVETTAWVVSLVDDLLLSS